MENTINPSLNSLFKFDNFTELDGTNGELFVLTQEPTLEDFQATCEIRPIMGDYNHVSGEIILQPSQRLIELADELHSVGMDKYDFSREKNYFSIGDIAFQGLRTKEAKAKKVQAYLDSEQGQRHLANAIEKRREGFKRDFIYRMQCFIDDRYTNCVTEYFTKQTKSILSVDTDLQKIENEIKELQNLIDSKEKERKEMYKTKALAHPFVQQLHPILAEKHIHKVTNTSFVITRGFFG
jgi:hypothetical protein